MESPKKTTRVGLAALIASKPAIDKESRKRENVVMTVKGGGYWSLLVCWYIYRTDKWKIPTEFLQPRGEQQFLEN